MQVNKREHIPIGSKSCGMIEAQPENQPETVAYAMSKIQKWRLVSSSVRPSLKDIASRPPPPELLASAVEVEVEAGAAEGAGATVNEPTDSRGSATADSEVTTATCTGAALCGLDLER